MPAKITVPFKKCPAQKRAEVTLRAIREAAMRILEADGPDRLTTNRIAEVAGVSIGSVYQYYPDKRAIAADICNELLLADLHDVVRIADASVELAARSVDETIRFIVEEIVARHRKCYRTLKGYYLDLHWRYDFEEYVAEAFPQHRHAAEWLPAAVLVPHAEELGIDDPHLASTMVMNAIGGTVHATLSRSPEMIFEDRFVEELVVLALAYLKAPRLRR